MYSSENQVDVMYRGECLCAQVKFQISGSIASIIHCHCSICRRANGTAYATNGFVRKSEFTVTEGSDSLTCYEHQPGSRRFFCKTCGSPIYGSNEKKPEFVRVRVGTILTDITERPMSHNFYSSRANWDDLDAELPRYDGFEPGRQKKD